MRPFYLNNDAVIYDTELEVIVSAKPIKGFPNYYITEHGRIWNVKKQRFQKTYLNYGYSNGRKKRIPYERVTLHNNGKDKHFYVHRLVAEHFLPNPDNCTDVDHINHDTLNNAKDNLQWLSHADNTRR